MADLIKDLTLMVKLEAQADRELGDFKATFYDVHDRPLTPGQAVAAVAAWDEEDPFGAVSSLVAELKAEQDKRFPAWRGYGVEYP